MRSAAASRSGRAWDKSSPRPCNGFRVREFLETYPEPAGRWQRSISCIRQPRRDDRTGDPSPRWHSRVVDFVCELRRL